MNFTANTSVSKLLFYINEYQQVQKANPCNSQAWQDASASLAILFAVMAEKSASLRVAKQA